MSITKKIFPELLTPVYNNVVSVVDSDNKNENSFQFIFDIKDGDGNRIARRKMPAAPSGFGVFDAQRVLESQVSADIYSNLTGITAASNALNEFTIEYGEEFEYTFEFYDNFFDSGAVGFTSNTTVHYFEVGDEVLITQDGTPTNPEYDGVHTVTSVIDDYAFVVNQAFLESTPPEGGTVVNADFSTTLFTGLTATSASYVYNGALPHSEFTNYSDDEYIAAAGSSKTLLTDVPNNWNFNYSSESYALLKNDTSEANYIRYDLSDGTTYRLTNADSSDGIYIPIGPENINNSTLGEIITSGISSYSAYTENSSSATTSQVLSFDVSDASCRPYDQYQLVFMDRKGSFMSFNFDLVSKENVRITRENFKKITGEYDSATNSWGYNNSDRGATNLNTDIDREIRVTSDYIPESFVPYLEQLFSSPEVYHILDGEWYAINITDTNFDYKYRNVDKLINYELKFKYSNNDQIQRG